MRKKTGRAGKQAKQEEVEQEVEKVNENGLLRLRVREVEALESIAKSLACIRRIYELTNNEHPGVPPTTQEDIEKKVQELIQ